MGYESTAFRVRGIEPVKDLKWIFADNAARRDFWRKTVAVTLKVKDESLAEGKGVNGHWLRAISLTTKINRYSAMGDADPEAPPLMPAYGRSRTRAYLKGRAMADHAEFFWTHGWGTILHYHRIGAKNAWAKSGRLPKRNVIGLSASDLKSVRNQMAAWWNGYRHSVELPEVIPEPKPRTIILPKREQKPITVKIPRPPPRKAAEVVYVKPGQRIDRRLNKIHVYSDKKPIPAVKAIKPQPAKTSPPPLKILKGPIPVTSKPIKTLAMDVQKYATKQLAKPQPQPRPIELLPTPPLVKRGNRIVAAAKAALASTKSLLSKIGGWFKRR